MKFPTITRDHLDILIVINFIMIYVNLVVDSGEGIILLHCVSIALLFIARPHAR